MSANTYFIDAATRRQIFVERYSKGLEAQSRDDIARLFDEVEILIRETPLTSKAATDRLKSEIRDLVATRITGDLDRITEQVVDFAVSEAEFTAEMLGGAITGEIELPSHETIRSSVYMTGFSFSPGVNVLRAMQRFGETKASQAVQMIDDGLLMGETSTRLSRRVGSLLKLSQTQAGSLVRTSISHSTTQARMRTMQTNQDIFDGYEWVSTLDSRTSLICIARDGMVYKFRPESPLPPAHFSCRSTVVPKVKDEFNLLKDVTGERPAVGPSGPGTISAKTTYSGWLRRQPKAFQEEVLGKERARLFRGGKISMSRFIDDSGRVYTLDELKSLNPLAFQQ